jgi:DNA-binding transcriptional LysR family regulator
MTLEQLHIFVAVAEREHVTRAAEALGVTQSAASNAIAALEARHGVALFHRVGRRIELTDAGRALLGEARTLLAGASAAERMLEDFGEVRRGTLRLVASQTIASYWLPARLAAFHARYPGVAVELAIDNTEGAAARVLDGSAELGFVEGEVDESALAHWTVGTDRMLLVSTTPTDTVDDAWIGAQRWIVREPGSGTRSTFEATLSSRGFNARRLALAMTLPSNEAVLTAVEAGAGVAALSELVVARAVAAGTLHALPWAMPARAFHALRHKERYRTRAADALTDMLKEFG